MDLKSRKPEEDLLKDLDDLENHGKGKAATAFEADDSSEEEYSSEEEDQEQSAPFVALPHFVLSPWEE